MRGLIKAPNTTTAKQSMTSRKVKPFFSFYIGCCRVGKWASEIALCVYIQYSTKRRRRRGALVLSGARWESDMTGCVAFPKNSRNKYSQKMRQNKRLNFVGVTTLRLIIFGSVEKYGRAVLSFENCHRELVFGRPIVVKFLSMRKKVEIDNVDPIYVFRAFLFKRHHDSRIKGGEKYRNNSNNCSSPKTAANRRAQRRLF